MIFLNNFSDLLSINRNGEYSLSCDIDCEGKEIKKILNVFSGSIDGCGYTIKNLVILEDNLIGDGQKVALFHEMCRATIRNIKFINITFKLPSTVYIPTIAALCVDAGESIFENVSFSLSHNNGQKIPLVYQSYLCTFTDVNISNNMILSKYE